jgi:D-aspartate ligase
MNDQSRIAALSETMRSNGKPGAIVLGGAHGSLAVVRSLGRHGIPVCVVTHDNPIAKFSRYATHKLSWPGPTHPDALTFLLRQTGASARLDLNGWMLFTGGDAEAEFVARNYAELSAVFRVTGPDWPNAKWAFDKHLTYERAAELGVDCPWSLYPRGRDEVAALDCRFPVILKPTVKDRPNAFTLAKAWRVDDRAELIARYDLAVGLVGEQAIVLQELIPGDGSNQFSYAAAWYRGAPLASLVARRTRQYPIDFGYTSTLVETIDEPEVEKAAVMFLKSLDYTGLVEVEFKFDERDRRYKILDVNARAWTWTALGGAAGVDFPWLLWRANMGEVGPVLRGRPNATWIHLARDVVAAGQLLPRGGISFDAYPKALRGPIVFAAFAMDDPMPGIIDLPLTVWRTLHTRLPLALRARQGKYDQSIAP